jgi:hypothetical protein
MSVLPRAQQPTTYTEPLTVYIPLDTLLCLIPICYFAWRYWPSNDKE